MTRVRLTVEVSPELSLFLPIFVQTLHFHLLPLHLIFFLDLQVAVQLGEAHRGQLGLWNQRRTDKDAYTSITGVC